MASWPPVLKTWVQDCLSRATPSNKETVNKELKQMIFQAHKDGTINTTNWSKVQLNSLQAQQFRSTHVIPSLAARVAPAPIAIPPPTVVTNHYPIPTPYSSASVPPPSEDGSVAGSGKKKKRKKNDGTKAFPTPYHFSTPDEAEALARRAARFQQPSTSSPGPAAPMGVGAWFRGDDEDDERPVMAMAPGPGPSPGQVGRKKLKGKGGLGYSGEDVMEVDPNVMDWDKHTIRGTNTKLEKSYLRLTSEPSPADIRPLNILKQTLQHLKARWKENHNYAYALDQFKSMRQDLTVQRIKNEFTVEVYEIHARIALEAKDLGEYNQCQTMLRQLYELGIKGHPQEFLSYRIIYLLHTRNRSDMAALLAQLTPAEKSDPGVAHALNVHASLATSNYVRFFRLYNNAPNMSGYIMDHFVERERMSALAIVSKAYLSLPLPDITTNLAFDSDEETDAFLIKHDVAIYTNVQVPPPSTSMNHWRPIVKPVPKPLHERVWDCKKAQAICATGIQKYRVVDLKGQVD